MGVVIVPTLGGKTGAVPFGKFDCNLMRETWILRGIVESQRSCFYCLTRTREMSLSELLEA